MRRLKSIYRFLVVLGLVVFVLGDGVAQCNNPDDYTALRALYLSTDGDNWTDNTGWPTAAEFNANPNLPSGTDMSGWNGIFCNFNDRVYFLQFYEDNMIGSIPDEIELLSELTHLRATYCGINGFLPESLGNLSNLNELHLYNNELSGEIPSTFGNLIGINQIRLSNNNLIGNIPESLNNLTSISLLEFGNNDLEGCFPMSLISICNVPFFSSNPKLPWQGDFDQFCLTDGSQSAQVGAPCNDGDDSNGTNDVIQNNCSCAPLVTCPTEYTITYPDLVCEGEVFSVTVDIVGGSTPLSVVITDGTDNFAGENITSFPVDIELGDPGLPPSGNYPLNAIILDGSGICNSVTRSSSSSGNVTIQSGGFGLSVPPDPVCSGEPYDITLSITTQAENNPPNSFTLNEFPSGDTYPASTSATETVITIPGNTAGTYDYSGSVTDNDNCFFAGPAFLSSVVVEDCPCTHPDYNALIALYNSTNGDNWINNGTNTDPQSATEGWGKDCDVCEWYGIQCNGDDRVTCIDLDGNNNCSAGSTSGNNLTGTLIAEIFGLSELDYLNLQSNQISGSLPLELFDLSNLTFLNLAGNEFNSTIPSEIQNLTSIEEIYLGANNFTGPIPPQIGNLSSLEVLNLSNNPGFVGTSIPTEICNLSLLNYLGISQSMLNGEIPEDIGNLSNLTYLSLSINEISGIVPTSIGNLSNLEFLYLDQNQLSGPIPSEIGNLTNLNFLHLWTNNLTGEIPQELGNLTTTNNISFTNNQLSGCFNLQLLDLCPSGNISFSNNSLLPWQGSFSNFCTTDGSMNAQVGAPCNDGDDSNGTNDEILSDCSCGQPCPTITPTLSGPTEVCEGDNATYTFNFSDGLAPYTITWNGGDVLTNINDGHTETLTNITADISLTVTDGTDAEGCAISSSNTINLTVNPLPSGNISGNFEICEGESTTITASGGNTYEWSTTETTSSITVNPLVNTTYTVTVTDGNLCTHVVSQEIIILPNPTAQISGTFEICEGESTTIIASGGNTYEWSTTESTPSITVNPSINTTYIVTVTDANLCTDITSQEIIVNPNPTVQITGNLEICESETTMLTASGGNSYLWSTGDNTPTIETNAIDTDYGVTVTDGNSCTAETTVTLTVNDLPLLVVNGDNEICNGETANITASGDGTMYNWDSGQNTAMISVSPSLTTTYTVTATDNNSCTQVASWTVTVNDLPIAQITGENEVCDGESITLSASGGTIYSWSDGQSGPSIDINPATNTTYTVTVSDANNCSSTASQSVTVLPLPVIINPSPISLCDDGSGSATTNLFDFDNTITDGQPGNTVTWSESNIEPLIPLTGGDNYTVSNSTILFAQVDNGICDSEIITINFLVENDIVVTNPSPIIICTDGGTGLNIDPQDYSDLLTSGNPSFSVNWSGSNTMSPLITNTIFINNGASLFAQVTDGDCSSIVTEISFQINSNPQATLPTNVSTCAFDMNGDGGFDLTVYEDVINNNSGFAVIWSEDEQGQNIINNPNSYVGFNGSLIYATVDDGICQSSPLEISLIVNQLPAVTEDFEIETCQPSMNESVQIDLSDFDEAISDGDITWSASQNDNLIITDPSNFQTSASVTIYAKATSNDCESEYTPIEINLTDSPSPMINALGGSTTICPNSSLELSINGTFDQIEWSTGEQGAFIEVTEGGTYVVTVTDGDCTGSGEIFITQSTLSLDCAVADDAVTIMIEDAALPYDVSWSSGTTSGSETGLTDNAYTIDNLPSGEYTVEVMDGQGCVVSCDVEVEGENTSNCDHADVSTLIELYNATGGEEWNNNDGWHSNIDSTNCDPCGLQSGNSEWYGITCENNRVTLLQLPDNGLVGELPSIIGLDSLEFLDLNTNDLRGNWNFKNVNLRAINISENPNLKTTVPNLNLPNLEQLIAYGDSLVGPLPLLDSVPALRELFIYSNEFDGPVPDWQLENLRGISLYSCGLVGNLPTLSLSTNLLQIYFDENNLTGNIPPYYLFPNVFRIKLNDNDLSGCMSVDEYCAADINFNFTNNPKLADGGVDESVCGNSFSEDGASCNDGNPDTDIDIINGPNCICGEEVEDMRPFVTTWVTNNPGITGDSSIRVPTFSGETYNYEVDWDYVMDTPFVADTTGITGDFEYNFGSEDTVTIAIRGEFPRIYFNPFDLNDNVKLLSISQWGDIKWQSMEDAFQGCINLNGIILDNPDLSEVTNMNFMFSGATSFNQEIGEWDVSNVTNMNFVFNRASSFNQDLNSWDVSNVTSMVSMFSGASTFNQNVGSWDVSEVTSMQSMFSGAFLFNQNIGSWDVSKVNDMNRMFSGAFGAMNFNQNIGSWDVSKVTKMNGMFTKATNFNQNISLWNVGNVTDMQVMFQGASAFNQDINNWDVSNVNTMSLMFQGATVFNQKLSDWNVSAVLDMSRMFYEANVFNQDINNWDVSNVTDMSGMFYNADAFNQSLESWDISSVEVLNDLVNGGLDTVAIFDNSGLSCENYSATLKGWAENPNTPDSLEMQAIGMVYNELGKLGRDSLLAKGWIITEDTLDLECSSPCIHPDYAALEAFYESTNGDDWDDNDGWLSNCDPCDSLNNYANPWYGLCCDESINRVRGIDMFGIANCDEDGAIVGSGNHLTGSIPLSINQLTELTFFDIEGSNVTGPIPSTLPDLVNLRYFDISENDMTGPIPNNIGNLQELIFFDLQANSINDTLPNSITEIKTLEFFDLESTGMFGKIPFGFGELNDLYLFDIQFNNFSGKLPDDIGNIDLDFFDVLGFYINDNNFSDCIPPSLSNYCDKLGVDVDIRNNPLIPNGGDYWDEFCDGQDQEGQPCGISLDSIIVDCNCAPVEDCPTPICKSDINEIIFIQEGRTISLERVLDDGFPIRDCYSFDPVIDVDTFLLVCGDVCTIKEVTVYNLTTGESCATDVYVSQQAGVCDEFVGPEITVELIDQGYTGGEFISIDVILDGLVDITEYSFQIQFDTFALEFIEGVNLNNELTPSVDFFTPDGPYVRVKRDDNSQSINSIFTPTRVATLVFRIKNQPFCGETTFDVATDAFNAFLTCQANFTTIEATYIPTTVIYNHPIPVTNPTLLEVCENEEITVNIINSEDYESIIWSETGSDELSVAPISTTDYELSLVDNNGCIIDTFLTITVIDCDDCVEGGCLASNPPVFLNPPIDVTVSCTEDIPSPIDLEYTNSMTDECLEDGSSPAMRDSSAFTNCQGTIVDSWSYTTLCGTIIETSRTITIESPGILMFDVTPEPFINISCSQDEIELHEISLDYMYDSGTDCIEGGTVDPVRTEDFDECGGTVSYTWSVDNPCGETLIFMQLATVSSNDNFEFIDPPADITLSCNQLPFLPDTLLITNNTEGACAVFKEIKAITVEVSEGCPGQIINVWTFDNPCTGVPVSHEQRVTLVDCAAATLEEDYIEVRAGVIYDVDLFDNDVIPDSFSTQIIEIERKELFLANGFGDNGVFEFAISESFFDTLRVTYEVCNLECDNCTVNTLKIVDEALKDIILTDIITPNGDGQNDVLRFNFENEIMGSQLYIYNRWGDKVYEKLSYSNDWDASGYPGGIYFYVLRIGDAEVKKTLTVVK